MVIFNSYVRLPESIANGKDDIPYIKWKITFMFETTIQFGKKSIGVTAPSMKSGTRPRENALTAEGPGDFSSMVRNFEPKKRRKTRRKPWENP